MAESRDRDGEFAGMLVPTGPAAPRPSLARSAPMAAFVSQIIASRASLPPPPLRPVGIAHHAIGSYGRMASMGQRRMPAGYRKTVVV